MTSRVLLAAALGLLGPPRGAAQERPEPRLLLSAFGGVAGGRHLWAVNRQPLFVLGTEVAPRYDTLRLSRDIRPGLVLGLPAPSSLHRRWDSPPRSCSSVFRPTTTAQ